MIAAPSTIEVVRSSRFADLDLDAQFLGDLAFQGRLGGLARFELAAGELPASTGLEVGMATAGQNALTVGEDGGDNLHQTPSGRGRPQRCQRRRHVPVRGRPVAHGHPQYSSIMPPRTCGPRRSRRRASGAPPPAVRSSEPKLAHTWVNTTSLSTSAPGSPRSPRRTSSAWSQSRSTSRRRRWRPSEPSAAHTGIARARRDSSGTRSSGSPAVSWIR